MQGKVYRVMAWGAVVCLISVVGAQAATKPALKATPGAPAAQSITAASTHPVVPQLIKFSGTLVDLAGKPIAGPVDVTFSLYAEQSGGTALWYETQTVDADAEGRYTALLGSMTTGGVPMSLFTSDQARWLGVMVNGLPEQARVLLVSVPYAMNSGNSEMLGGKPAADYLLAGSGGATTVVATTSSTSGGGRAPRSMTTAGPLTATPCTPSADGSGAARQITLYSGPCNLTEDASFVDVGGKVGIGITNPLRLLEVSGANAAMRFNNTATNSFGFFDFSTAGTSDAYIYDFAPGYASSGLDIAGSVKLDAEQTGGLTLNALNAAGVIRLATANLERMRITSAGKVGIGTTSPTANLEVNGTAKFDQAVTFAQPITTSGSETLSGSTTTGGVINATQTSMGAAASFTNSGTGDILDAYSSGGQVMRVDNAGNIITGGLLETNSSVYVDAIGVNSGSVTPGVNFGVGGEGIASKRTSGGNQYGLDFYTGYAANMSITNAGRVGIGTTTPISTVELHASVNAPGPGPILTLTNTQGNGTTTAIDFNTYAPSTTGTYNPSARIVAIDDNWSNDIAFENNIPGGPNKGLVNQLELTTYGQLVVDASHENDGALVRGGVPFPDLIFGGVGSGEGIFSDRGTTDGASHQYSLDFTTSGLERLTIQNDGSVGIGNMYPATRLQVDGDIRVGTSGTNGCIQNYGGSALTGTCSSDARLKKNIRRLPPVLDRLAELRPVTFDWRVNEFPQYHFGNQRNTGLIAQEVRRIFPDLVETDARGYMMVNYSEIPLLLLRGVRELKERNDNLSAQVREAHAEMTKLQLANAAKDAQLLRLRHEVRSLRKQQQEIATIEGRLARDEAQERATSVKLARVARKQKKGSRTELARVQF